MLTDLTPAQFLDEYAVRTNTHQFPNVAELIAPDAIYWFNDGSFYGLEAIQNVFVQTWSYIQNETYQLKNVQWLAVDEHIAVCVYTFHWRGLINDQLAQGSGRGTSVLHKKDRQWQVVHEHLSPNPPISR
jgi:ketosteroid isomerase-like protein